MLAKRALLSVSDKASLAPFAAELQGRGWEIVSSGGTARGLQAAGLTVQTVEEVTGFPEILGGRVKTLHPNIHGGILARQDNEADMIQLAVLCIQPFSLVVVNLYPFEAVAAKEGATALEVTENIDIGGVTLICAAAKNWRSVAVVTSVDQYPYIISDLQQHGGEISMELRVQLAYEAFLYTAWYDTAIMHWFAKQEGVAMPLFPERLLFPYELKQELRYGENPHQKAAFYRETGFKLPSVVTAVQQWGKVPSATTIGDLNAGVETVRELIELRNFFKPLAAVVIKHNTPCGVAIGDSPVETYVRAREADPLSAFGGVIACNFPIDVATAVEICKIKVDGVIAPGFADDQALEIIQKERAKGKTPIFTLSELEPLTDGYMNLKPLVGGIIYQEADLSPVEMNEWAVVTERQVPNGQWRDILFGWLVIKHVKSNSIIVVKDGQTLGIGSGQTSRIGSAKIALEQAGAKAKGAILISDALCPFDDVVREAAKFGIETVVQTGGSIKDQDSINAANELGLAMVFTHKRAFWH